MIGPQMATDEDMSVSEGVVCVRQTGTDRQTDRLKDLQARTGFVIPWAAAVGRDVLLLSCTAFVA